ncbi:MAG: C-terminal binding protein [Acidimicrobiia bacterium]
MRRFKVLVSDQVFPDLTIERELLGAIGADLLVADGSTADVIRQGADADALLNTYLPIDAHVISGLQRCRIIARYGIGFDNVDLAAAKTAGITVTNVPDYCVEEVAAHAVAMILSLLRKLPEADARLRAGGWGIEGLQPIPRISGLTFGLVGYGRIARQVAAVVQSLGAALVVHDPYVSAGPGMPALVSLEELARRSDVVSIHVPLTPETQGLVNRTFLDLLSPRAILVNTSRGKLVVLDDLVAALRTGRLAGAGLDVFDQEPVEVSRIEGVPNLIVTPHLAYYSEQSLAELQRKATTQVVKVLSGAEPDYRVG